MTKVPFDVYLANGKSVRLGPPVPKGSGREGTVFELPADPSRCAKIYHSPPGDEQVRKLELMVDNPPPDPTLSQADPHPSIVWPKALVFQERPRSRKRAKSKCIGFLMPKVDLSKFQQVLCYFDEDDLVQRFRGHFTWEHSLYIARNLASAMAAIHGKGYCVGDINGSNLYAAPTGRVTLLDCDSFQVPDPGSGRMFRCNVGVEEYTAPEIQGRPFSDVDRTRATDTFALAVLLFQLLMKNTLPYAAIGPGVDDAPSTVDKIKKGLFPYPDGQKHVKPPPYAPPYTILPQQLATLFEKCFRLGHKVPQVRPSALDWLNAFDLVLDNQKLPLRGCTKNSYHRYLSQLSSCPWCDHSSGTGNGSPPLSSVRRPQVTSGSVLPQVQSPQTLHPVRMGSPTPGPTGPPASSIPPKPRSNSSWGWALMICLGLGFLFTWMQSQDRLNLSNDVTHDLRMKEIELPPDAPIRAATSKSSDSEGGTRAELVRAKLASDLRHSAKTGEQRVVEELLVKGAAVNEVDEDGWSPLLFAASKGHRGVVALLLKNGAAVNQTNKDGRTPLLGAAENGHRDVAALLLKNGAAVDQADKYGGTALLLAAVNGHRDVAALLLKNGAVVNQTDKNGVSPLMYASRNGHRDVVELLRNRGAVGNKDERPSPVFRKIKGGYEIGKTLCNTLDMGRCYPRNWTLWVTALANSLAGEKSSELKTDTGTQGPKDWSLQYPDGSIRAVFFGCRTHACPDAGAYFLIDVTRQEMDIIWYKEDGVSYIGPNADLLREHHVLAHNLPAPAGMPPVSPTSDASANSQDSEEDKRVELARGNLPSDLYHFAKFGEQRVVAELLEKGAPVNQADRDGWTPLHIAAHNGHQDVVAMLIKKGAVVNQADKDGMTPLFVAAENGHRDVVALLLEKGAAVNQTDKDGWFPLLYAARNGHGGVVALLLEKGAAVNQADKNGTTALLLADNHGYRGVVSLLLEKGATRHHEPGRQ